MAIDKNTVTKEAQKFAAKGQFDQAIAEWKKLLAESPNDPNIYNTIGDLCLKKQSKPGAVDAYMHAANLLAADGFTSKAIALYKKVLNIDATKMEAHLALGDMNAEKGLTGNALENYKHAADHYIQHKDTAKALDIYQKMADLNPANVAFQIKLGDMYAKQGIKDKSARAYIAAADVHVSKSEFKDARQLFEKVLTLDPDNKTVYHKAGIVYFKEGKFVEACKAFKHVFESDPSNEEVADLYIDALAKAGKDAEAEQVLRKLLSLHPDDAGLREKLYNLYLAKKDYDRAVVEAATLADSRVKAGNAGAAEELLKAFVAASPVFPPGRQKLAEFYISVKRPEDAAEELLQAAELYLDENDLLNAKAVLTQAAEVAPNLPRAKERLKDLEEPAPTAPLSAAEFTPDLTPDLAPDLSSGLSSEFTSELTSESEPFLGEPSLIVPEPLSPPVFETPIPTPPPAPAPAPPVASAAAPFDEEPAVAEAIAEADVLIKYGLAAKAIEQLEALSSKFPESPRIRIKLRDLYRDQGDLDKAVRHALLSVALFTKFGREDLAMHVLQATADMAPDHPAIIARLGRVPAAPAPPAAAPKAAPPAERKPEIAVAAPAAPPPPRAQDIAEEITFEGLDSPIPSFEEPVPEEIVPESEPLQPEPIEPEPQQPAPPTPVYASPVPEPPVAENIPAYEPEPTEIAPPPPSVDISEIWAEAEFYFQQGLFDEAKKHYEQIIALTPGDQRAVDRLSEISREEDETMEFSKLAEAVEELEDAIQAQANGDETAASASDDEAVRSLMQEINQLKQETVAPPLEKKKPAPPQKPAPVAEKPAAPPPPPLQRPAPVSERPVAPPPQRPAPVVERPIATPQRPAPVASNDADDDFFDLGEELQRDQVSAPRAPVKQESASDDFFDLAAELRDDLSNVPVPAKTAVPADEQSLDDIFDEFKKGVEQQSVKEDADTHYNLGVAYKEMGLLDDAIGEFILTPEDESKFVQSRYMLGLCYMEKGEYQNAIGEIQNALDYSEALDSDLDARNRIEMRYDLGLAYQGAGNNKNAISEFQKIADEDRGYRDVAAKLKELHKGDFISLDQLKDDIEKEISSKFLEEGVRIEREEKTRKSERVRS